jgi:hypothetical protein
MRPLLAWCRLVPRVVLGVFIVWQLLFLPAANLCGVLTEARNRLAEWPPLGQAAPEWTRGRGTLHRTTEAVAGVTARWAEVTGQPQSWSLFAPEVGPDVAFVAVELRWDDDPLPVSAPCRRLAPLAASNILEWLALQTAALRGERPDVPSPVLLLSDNEPADPHAYFRLGRFRLRRYEDNIDLILDNPEGKPTERMADAWNQKIEVQVWRAGSCHLAYLRWRRESFRRAHPDLPPPRQVLLYTRTYRIPEPGSNPWDWQGPEQLPLLRWRPGVSLPPGESSLERYNPVVPRFEKFSFADGLRP